MVKILQKYWAFTWIPQCVSYCWQMYVAQQSAEHIAVLAWQCFHYLLHCLQQHLCQQHTKNIFLYSCGNNGYRNAPQCWIICLPCVYLQIGELSRFLYMYWYIHLELSSIRKYVCWYCNGHNFKVEMYSALTYLPLLTHVLVCVFVCKKLFVYVKCQQRVGQNSGVYSGDNWTKNVAYTTR